VSIWNGASWSEVAGKIVETAFAAAVDDSLWEKLTQQIIAVTGTAGAFLGILDDDTGHAVHCMLTNGSAQAYEEYIDNMVLFDPQAKVVGAIRGSHVYTDRDHLDWDDSQAADYMAWQEDRLGWLSHVTIASRLDPTHCSGMSFHLSRDDAHRTEEVRRFLEPISGALSQALQLGFLHNDKLTHEYWLGLSAEIDQSGAFLISERGSVMRMNAMAERLVSSGHPCMLRLGKLQCRTIREQERIDSMVGNAVARTGPAPSFTLFGDLGANAWFARISPIVRQRRALVIDEPAALLTIRPLNDLGPGLDAQWRELFGLTGAEAKVADLLRHGLSTDVIAARLNITAGTARTHTKAIHDKTETRRNAELAHLLTLLANQK